MTETTTERTIGAREVLELLKKARDRRGAEYVYPPAVTRDGCVYVERDDKGNLHPSCIVGDMLVTDVHVEPEWFLDNAVNETASFEVTDLLPGVGVTLTPLANHLLATAQDAQDGGATWGVAVERAERQLSVYERIAAKEKTDAEAAYEDYAPSWGIITKDVHDPTIEHSNRPRAGEWVKIIWVDEGGTALVETTRNSNGMRLFLPVATVQPVTDPLSGTDKSL